MKEELKVGLLPNDPNTVLAVAGSCFNLLKIPTCHTEFEEFLKYMERKYLAKCNLQLVTVLCVYV